MQLLPAPEQTLDLRTQFGVVRVYRFTSSAVHRPGTDCAATGPCFRFTNLG